MPSVGFECEATSTDGVGVRNVMDREKAREEDDVVFSFPCFLSLVSLLSRSARIGKSCRILLTTARPGSLASWVTRFYKPRF